MDESTKQIKVYPGGLKRGRNFALEPEWTNIQVGLYPGGPLFGILQYLLGQLTPKLCLKSVSFPWTIYYTNFTCHYEFHIKISSMINSSVCLHLINYLRKISNYTPQKNQKIWLLRLNTGKHVKRHTCKTKIQNHKKIFRPLSCNTLY